MIFPSFSVRMALLCTAAAMTACSGGGATSAPDSTVAKKSGPVLYALSSNASPDTSTPPAGVIGVQSLNLTFTGTGQTNAVLAYETSYVGSFTVVASSCTNAAGAASGTSPATATFAGSTSGSGPGAVLTVTAGATGGTCTFTVSDSQGNTAVLFVGTSLTGGTIS